MRPADSQIVTRARLLIVATSLLLGACATAGSPQGGGEKPAASAASRNADGRDPLEGFNRAMYTFNETLDDYLLKPVARGYQAALPSPVRTGVSNFFSNLREPMVIVNDLLQGKFAQALQDTARFVANTIIGIYGLLDPATHLGLPKHDEDFGQTLAVWGAGEGWYIVWPFLGPSTVRDTAGIYVNWQTHPYDDMEETSTRNKLIVLETVDTRAQLLDATDILEQAAGQDPYVFVREAYRQRRTNLIYDGNPPRAVPEELFEDEPPAPAGPTPPTP